MAVAHVKSGCSLGAYRCSLGCQGWRPDGGVALFWPNPKPLQTSPHPLQVAGSVPELHAIEAHTFELPQPSRRTSTLHLNPHPSRPQPSPEPLPQPKS